MTLADMARSTKLSASTLRAIEEDDFGRLPGGLFQTAYVRTVATEVGLDAEALVRECKERLAREAAAAQDAHPPPPPAARDRYLSALQWIAALAIAAAGLWWSASLNARPEPEIEVGPPALAAETFHLIAVPASVTSEPATPQ